MGEVPGLAAQANVVLWQTGEKGGGRVRSPGNTVAGLQRASENIPQGRWRGPAAAAAAATECEVIVSDRRGFLIGFTLLRVPVSS